MLLVLSCAGSGGGTTVKAPDTVKAGEPIVITLEAISWGGPVRKRYSDISLEYRFTGETAFRRVQAASGPVTRPTSGRPEREVGTYTFNIPAVPDSQTGELEYRITLKFDGYVNRRPGGVIPIHKDPG